jgi:hypothetical protein
VALNPPWTLKGKTVSVGLTDPPSNDMSCQFTAINRNENAQMENLPPTACQDGVSSYQQSNPTVTLSFYEDWSTTTGLCVFLSDHHNQSGFISVRNGASGTGWKQGCTFIRPDWVSPADTSAAQTTVTLPLQGMFTRYP